MIRNFLAIFCSFLFLLHLSGSVVYAYSSEVDIDKDILANLKAGMNARFSDFPVVYRVEEIRGTVLGPMILPDGPSNNRYTVHSGAMVQMFLKGSAVENGQIANNNVVIMNNNTKIMGNLLGVEGVGGGSYGATNNTVTLNGHVMFNNAYGVNLTANTAKSTVSGNKFTLTNGKITGLNGGTSAAQSVFGVASDFAIDANNNLFEISSSEVYVRDKIIGIDITNNGNSAELTSNTYRMVQTSINDKELLAYNVTLSGNGSVNFTSNNVELDRVSKFSKGSIFKVAMGGAGPTSDNSILLSKNTVTISNISEAKAMDIANNITNSDGNNIISTNSNYASFSGIALHRGGDHISSTNDTISLTEGKINTTFNGITVGNGSAFNNASTITSSNILLKNISTGDTASANGNVTGIDIKSTTANNSQFDVTGNNMVVYGDDGSKSVIAGDIKGVSSSHQTSNITGNNLFIGQDASGTAGFITVSKGTTATNTGGNVYGVIGSSLDGATISNNKLFVGGNAGSVSIANDIYGVKAEGTSANITHNNLFFGTNANNTALSANGGGNLYGVHSTAAGNITSNTLTLAGTSSVTSNVYGVNATNNNAIISENILKIGSASSSVSINGNIYGTSGNKLSKNFVYLTGSVNGFQNLYGSYGNGANSEVSGNLVHVAEGSNIASASSNIYGAYSREQSNMTSNRIVIGSIEKADGLNNNVASFSALAKNYTTTVSANQIVGAYSEANDSSLSKNEVVIAADANVTGQKIAGALSKGNAGLLSNNRVAVLNNANITGSLYGAYAEGATNTTNVSDNIVTIGALPNDHGIVKISDGHIYGGYSDGTGNVTNNIVQLVGHNDLSTSDIYGGYSAKGNVSGNILYLDKYKGNVKNIYNFETITFKPSSKEDIYKWTKDTTILNIVGGQATDLTNTKITNTPEFLAQAGTVPQDKEMMHLIKNDQGITIGANTIDKNAVGVIRAGFGTEYKYTLNTTANSIEMVVDNASSGNGQGGGNNQGGGNGQGGGSNGQGGGSQNDQKPGVDTGPTISIELEALLGGRDALALMVKRAGDMVAFLNGNIIRPLDENLNTEESGKKIKYGTFLVSGGGYIKDEGVNTTLEASRGSVLTGFGAAFNEPIANIFLSAFFEGGYGTYTRNGDYSDASTTTTVHGKGSSDYYGAGLVLRSDFKIKPEHTVYLDTSFRGGLTGYDFQTDDIYTIDASNKLITASYDSANAYYGTHIGLGYMYNLNNKYIFDVYAKYLFNYYDADKVTLPNSETVSFDDFYSHRINTGLRVTFTTPVAVNPYIGAGFEYQADESIGGSLNDTLRLKGHESTLDVLGAFELGFTYSKKFSKVGLNIDVKGKGTAGSLYSGAGMVDLRIDF